MSRPEPLLDHYRAVLNSAESMRRAARANDWTTVAGLAQRIRSMTEQLERLGPAGRLDADGNRERLDILSRLVAIDAEVRYLREPWLARIDGLLAPAAEPRAASPAGGLALEG